MIPTSAEIGYYLELPDSIDKMIKATKENRPALEPVIPILMKNVKGDYTGRIVRQITGVLAKKIMATQGYEVNRKDQRVSLNSDCLPFNTASKYKKT
jgi:hypothetical protein